MPCLEQGIFYNYIQFDNQELHNLRIANLLPFTTSRKTLHMSYLHRSTEADTHQATSFLHQ